MNPHSEKYLNDPTFQSVVVACLEKLERGDSLDRDDLLRDYPDYADAIDEFLGDQELLKQIAGQVQESSSGQGVGAAPAKTLGQTIDSTPRSDDFSTGDRIRYIGEYEILEEIARGGMGIVFKARQQKLRRLVALKMILAGRLADDADVERFYREAQTAGRLKHPNIVPVHEIGEHDGRHYFTMDFVDGRSLAEEIREESLAPRRAAEIVRVAAEAVQFAHGQGTVHRDLKPANVLLTDDGAPHLTDFGLAKMLQSVDEESRAELTAAGQILGTPSYMSPEQASGKQELIGPASDIYSLGAILYACLTGRAPFVADSPVDTLLQVMKKDPVSPRELNPSVPKDLETICLKCLTKEPHKRYGTARELADDLTRFLEGRPVVARPVGPISKTARWCRRNKAIATLLCLLFLSMAVGTYLSTIYAIAAIRHANSEARQRLLAETAREEAESAQLDAEQSLAKEEAARREAELRRLEALWQTYVARLQPMMYRFEQREYGQLESMLEQARPQSPDEPDFRGWEWHYLYDLGRQQTSELADGERFSQFFDWHAGTKRLAAFRGNELELWAGEPLKLQKRITTHPARYVRFSPDGTQLAVADQLTVKVFAVASGEVAFTIGLAEHQETNRNSKFIKSLEWRPDGSALATGTNMGAIHLWNPDDGNLLQAIQLLPHNFPCNEMHWHPTDPVLAVATRYGYVFALDTEQDKVAWHKKIDRDFATTVRWNPSGTMAAGATNGTSDGSRLVVWSRDGEEMMRSAGGAITGTPAIDWLNDEDLLVATTDHDLHYFRNDHDVPTKTIRVHDGPVQRILHYGDGKRVVTSSENEIRVTRVRDEVKLAAAVRTHKHGIKAISWSPDSQRVATVSWDGLVSITNVRTGEVIHELDGHANGAVNDVAWSPDGLRVASCDHSDEFRIWDPDAGKLLSKFDGVQGLGEFNSVAWIDNHRIVGGQRTVAIYNVVDGTSLVTLAQRPHNYARLAYNPTRQLIGHLGNNRLTVFDPDGTQLFQTRIQAMMGVAWSPDGKLLVTGGDAGIGVFDCVNFKFLTTIKGHAGTVTDACFSPDGSRIASSGRDGTVRVWDRATGAELLILEHPDVRSFHCVDWSPDGSTIAAGAGGWVVAWHASSHTKSRRPASLPTGVIASVKSFREQLAELNEAIQRNPSDVTIIRQRADLHASQLMWNEALADYRKIVEIKTRSSWEPVCAARAALMMGNVDDYRRLLAGPLESMLDGKLSDWPVTCDFIATTAALVPSNEFDWAALLPMSHARSNANRNGLWASRGVILLQLRLGNMNDVLNLLDKYKDEKPANHRIFLSAVRALANHHLGNSDAAEQALKAAEEIVESTWYSQAERAAITYSDLGVFVEASVMLAEAKANILDPARASVDKDEPGSSEAVGDSVAHEGGHSSSTEARLLDQLNSDDSSTRVDALKAIARLGLTEASFNRGEVEFSNSRFSSSLGPNPVPYELDPTTAPAAIDLVITHDGKTTRGLGIYKIEGDTLTLVMHEPSTSYRPQRFVPDIPPKRRGNKQDVFS